MANFEIGRELIVNKSGANGRLNVNETWKITKVTDTQVTAERDGKFKRFYKKNGWEVGAGNQTMAEPLYVAVAVR